MVKDKRFEKIQEGIYQELLKANQHFKICWGIQLASNDIARAKRIHLSFFYFTMRGNNDRFCLAIHNIVKPDKKTANFEKLFNYVRNNRELEKIFSQEEIDELKAIIQSHEGLIGRIKVIRDQYVAHNQLTKKHLEEEATYKYEEGKRLLIDLNNILERISHKYDGRSLYWKDEEGLLDISPSLDVDSVLRNLTGDTKGVSPLVKGYIKGRVPRGRSESMKGVSPLEMVYEKS